LQFASLAPKHHLLFIVSVCVRSYICSVFRDGGAQAGVVFARAADIPETVESYLGRDDDRRKIAAKGQAAFRSVSYATHVCQAVGAREC
jgi:hypothetical protein